MWTTPLFYTWTPPLFGVVHNTQPGRLHPIPDDSTLVRTTPFYLGRVRFLGKVHSSYTTAIVVVVVVVVVVGVGVVVVVVLKASRLPRQKQQRPSDPGRRRASSDIYEGPESATPATQTEPKASRLPRQKQRRPSDTVRRRASADTYEGPASTTPATQMEPEVLKVSRLPRKWSLRC